MFINSSSVLLMLFLAQPATAQYRVYQFDRDQIPRIDGVADDWDVVPQSYAVGSDQLKDTLRGTKNDPETLDVRVKVGWVKGLNRLYFLYEAYDDYWDFEKPGMHNDIFEVMIDGDASGGPITAIADPAVKHGSWEGYLMQGVQAQNYHIFTPAKGKNWAMVWGCQPWALEFPWSNAAQSYDFKHGESGRYTLEFWITPFDHAPIDGPDKAVVSKLKEGNEIGLSWVVLDYDDEDAGKNGYRSFNNLSRNTQVHSDADLLRRFRLMPLDKTELKADWTFKILDAAQGRVKFRDKSTGSVRSWHWDFGDGNTSTEQHPVHTYKTGSLNKIVTLKIENEQATRSFSRVWEVCLPNLSEKESVAGADEFTVELAAQQQRTAWNSLDSILQQIKPPAIPERKFNIADFGGIGDGVTDNRQSIAAAIAAAGENGGQVIFPQGEYFVDGPIHFKSNVHLHLEANSRIFFSSNARSYLPAVKVRFEGTVCYNYSPLIYGIGLKNISITGQGVIDGNAANWSKNWRKKQNPDKARLRQMGNDTIADEYRVFGNGFLDLDGDGNDDGHGDGKPHFLRPSLIEFYECKNIRIEGVTIKNSPFWTVHPVFSENITLRDLTVFGDVLNDDGIDPDSCQYVLIEGCTIETRDDAISLKAGRDQDAWNRPSCRNIVVRNNRLLSGVNAFCIGSEMSGGVEYVFAENNFVANGKNALNFKCNLDRGGQVQHVYLRDFEIESCKESMLIFTMGYHGYRGNHFPTKFNDIYVSNIRCKSVDQVPFEIGGVESEPIRRVYLSNIAVGKAGKKSEIAFAENILFEHVEVEGKLLQNDETDSGHDTKAKLREDQWMETAVANTYDPESLRIRTQWDFAAPAEKVWSIIAGFNTLPDYHASIAASELKEGGVVRHLTMSDDAGGGIVVERLVFFDDVNRTFSYRITNLIDCEMAFRNYQAWVHLESTGEKTCRLHWGSNFDVAGATDEATDELARVIYQGCFDGIQRVLEAKP